MHRYSGVRSSSLKCVLTTVILALGCAPVYAGSKPAKPADSSRKFVLDVVRSAVALPESDPQDRLRVLATAAQVTSPIDPQLARQFTREGVQIETRLVAAGEDPAVSLLASGQADCAAAQQFVESLPPNAVDRAEQSLIGAVTTCPGQTLSAAQRKLQGAGAPAPRATLAVMQAAGLKSGWSQQEFDDVFSSLPGDAEPLRADAPALAQLYAEAAPAMDKAVAQRAGLALLEWLGHIDADAPERNVAVNTAVDAMKSLFRDRYQDILSANVAAQHVAQTAGQGGELSPPPEEVATVQSAAADNGPDAQQALNDMPASQRAREAAAHGFVSGTSGDSDSAGRFFDTAFSALDEVWSNRSPQMNAAAVVEEVADAAAQVDPVMALQRAQHLQDPAAEAIGMLSIARVVASHAH